MWRVKMFVMMHAGLVVADARYLVVVIVLTAAVVSVWAAVADNATARAAMPPVKTIVTAPAI
jgi:hypothetical protein